MAKDLLNLKLERALVKEKLKANEAEISKLNDILKKKSLTRKTLLPLDEQVTARGVPLATLRVPMRSIKSLPIIDDKMKETAQPSPIINNDILRIRQEHMKKHLGQEEVVRRMKIKEEKQKREQKRNQKRQYPKIRIPESMLPNRYVRGELPCTIEHGISGQYLSWACPLENLDYEYYLPIFFDGLQCREQPACFLSRQGIEDMLLAARGSPQRIIPSLKSLVLPLRNALSKYDSFIALGVLKAIQELVQCHSSIGKALLPFCKQFIGPISVFLDDNRNIGDSIDYGQRKNDDIGEEVLSQLYQCLQSFMRAFNVCYSFSFAS